MSPGYTIFFIKHKFKNSKNRKNTRGKEDGKMRIL
jgi:hypothetical protein